MNEWDVGPDGDIFPIICLSKHLKTFTHSHSQWRKLLKAAHFPDPSICGNKLKNFKLRGQSMSQRNLPPYWERLQLGFAGAQGQRKGDIILPIGKGGGTEAPGMGPLSLPWRAGMARLDWGPGSRLS